MTRYTIVAALAAAGLCGAAHAQSPRPDPWGDATVSRADEQKQAEERFDALDTDHDGSLSAKEQAAAQNQRGPGGGGLRRADTDGDGKVGKQEYVAAQLRRFDMQDADKDGQFDLDGATLDTQTLRDHIRYRNDTGQPVRTILL